ncbi:MAG: WecB/TagA/CpsF family glycosyltransferase [Chlorobia bacterium]|nr:WecB/TagA/CpsF family glycosyltransferase [Fimbriimonadaceae bacterium]
MDSVPKVRIYGLPVWHVSVEELCDLVVDWSVRGEGHWIATLNLDYVSRCQRDPQFQELLQGADVFTADGMPVLVACRKLDARFAKLDRTTGADLTPKLIAELQSHLVGIVGGVTPAAALKKLGRDPGDYFIFDGKVELDETWVRDLAEKLKGRSVVFVALGCPKQEKMIELLRPHLPSCVFIAVGGSFEMIAGITRRAPKWMQRYGLEWLFRLAIEPRRLWRRYLLEYPPGAFALYRWVRATRRTASNTLPPT